MASATGPGIGEVATKFMSLQAGVEGVFLELCQSDSESRGHVRVPLEVFASGSNEGASSE